MTTMYQVTTMYRTTAARRGTYWSVAVNSGRQANFGVTCQHSPMRMGASKATHPDNLRVLQMQEPCTTVSPRLSRCSLLHMNRQTCHNPSIHQLTKQHNKLLSRLGTFTWELSFGTRGQTIKHRKLNQVGYH